MLFASQWSGASQSVDTALPCFPGVEILVQSAMAAHSANVPDAAMCSVVSLGPSWGQVHGQVHGQVAYPCWQKQCLITPTDLEPIFCTLSVANAQVSRTDVMGMQKLCHLAMDSHVNKRRNPCGETLTQFQVQPHRTDRPQIQHQQKPSKKEIGRNTSRQKIDPIRYGRVGLSSVE